jgi:hypothetical protein
MLCRLMRTSAFFHLKALFCYEVRNWAELIIWYLYISLLYVNRFRRSAHNFFFFFFLQIP